MAIGFNLYMNPDNNLPAVLKVPTLSDEEPKNRMPDSGNNHYQANGFGSV